MTIGKRYLVPCVKIVYELSDWGWGSYVPVIGPLHDDKHIIGFYERHWHIDFRFLINAQWERIESYLYGYKKIHGGVIRETHTSKTVMLRKMMYKRVMPQFPTEIPFNGPQGTEIVPIKWLVKLESAYADHKMKCLTCPHRGVVLDGLPVVNGAVTCPAHGLTWNVKTGMLRRRTKEVSHG